MQLLLCSDSVHPIPRRDVLISATDQTLAIPTTVNLDSGC